MLKTYRLRIKVYVKSGPLTLFSQLLPFPLPIGARCYYLEMLSYGNVPDAQQSELTSS